MATEAASTPIGIHTLTTLCDELVSGRAVTIDDAGTIFQFCSNDTRSLFGWYRANNTKWAGNVQKADVEAMVDQMLCVPSSTTPLATAGRGTKRGSLHLGRMVAHRFGGIHPFGTADSPPSDFSFDFTAPLTLIEGINGAGKTSILNAISWCLTGSVYRPQRPPETAGQSVPVCLATEDEVPDSDTAFDMTPITPLPSGDTLVSLGKKNIPLDTWVELSFIDDAGGTVATLRRSLRRTSRGKIEVDEPDWTKLGLTPLARDVGTRMPGLVPYIRLGEACDIGKAVSILTGIRPLEDLAKHAEKAKAKLDRDLVNDRNAEIATLDEEFGKAQQGLLILMNAHPDIDPKSIIPAPGDGLTVEDALEAQIKHFEELQAKILGASTAILGDKFDPKDAKARSDLTASVGPALGLLDGGHLKTLTSAARLSGLGGVDDASITRAEELIATAKKQSEELARLAKEPDVAARLRLYARIASWMRDSEDISHDLAHCPVCKTILEGKTDPVTTLGVSEHLSQYLHIDSGYLAQTMEDWESSSLSAIRDALPAELQAELRRDLPPAPTDLVRHALTEQLFESRFLQGSLLPLKAAAKSLCDAILAGLPAFVEPRFSGLPEGFNKGPDGLEVSLKRLTRAISFIRWRRENDLACKAAFAAIIGKAPAEGAVAVAITAQSTLHELLSALQKMVQNAEPLTNALAAIVTMKAKLKLRRDKEQRIGLYVRASTAIGPLLGLKALVAAQVSSLVNALSAKTAKWKKALYLPAFSGAPEVARTDVRANGSLKLEATACGTKTVADHITNASDLRATLLAFLLAFWEHVMEVQGGLSLLLLDDLHELFDRHNRRRLANSIPAMLAAGGRVLMTTNDHSFGRAVLASMKKADVPYSVDHRQIHTLKPYRDHIELGHFLEEIDSKRTAFERLENEAQPARDYIKDLRIYLEDRLVDLFEVPQAGLPKQPTLSDLIGAVRSRLTAGYEAFSGTTFKALVSEPALRNGSSFLTLMNESHHSGENNITYRDVLDVSDDCIRVRKLIDGAHEEYGLWMRRDPRDPPATAPTAPATAKFPPLRLPVLTDLAAFTSETSPAETEESDESLTEAVFANHAIYFLNSHNFGFSALPCSRVIVSTKEADVPDNSLVIALHKGHAYARRLLKSVSTSNLIALGSDAENPLKRPPSLFLPTTEVRLLQVAGVLFDSSPAYPKQPDEAWPLEAARLLDRVKIAFRVRGDSAVPLALPNQLVLGGPPLASSDVAKSFGRLVAIATDRGAAFKRVGPAVQGFPHILLFESVGGLGESMLVRLEEKEDGLAGLPLLASAREVLGVLYAPTGTV